MKAKIHANGRQRPQRLRRGTDVWEPSLPPADAEGNYPASGAMAVSIARSILRDRRRLGLSQAELARLAGIRPTTLDRIERGQGKATVRTIDKIEGALKTAQRRAKKAT
jgi:ribosome-binding protein aMBF1 (putative translation factor)